MSNDSPDPQDVAEALDSDKVGSVDDTAIEPDYPFEQLLGADEFGTTSAEEQVGEPFDERVAREEPEPLVEELEAAEESAAHDADRSSVAAALDELELELDDATLAAVDAVPEPEVLDPLADEPAPTAEVGRLVEPGLDQDLVDVDTEPDSIAQAFDEDDLSAEEAAVHLTADPPMGTLDGDYT